VEAEWKSPKVYCSYDIQEWDENNKAFIKSIRTLNIDTEERIDAPLMKPFSNLRGINLQNTSRYHMRRVRKNTMLLL
jgi:hypothetical protein